LAEIDQFDWLFLSKLLPQQYVIRIKIRTLTTYLRIRSPTNSKGEQTNNAILSRLTTTSAKESVSDGTALLLVIYYRSVVLEG